MKILITGAAGFLGYHLSQGLAEHQLVLLDIADFVADEVPPGAVTVRADVRDADALSAAMRGCDAVIHTAAGLPLWKPAEIRSVNLEGTRTVLDCALAQDPAPLVLHISSTAVYGIPDHHPLFEDDPMVGVGPYGESKVAAEGLCRAARKQGLCVPILRPKTFIGPERLGVFQILFEWIHEGRRIPVIGNGRNRYQLLAVEDLVAAIPLLLEKGPAVNHTFNIGAVEFGTVEEDLGALFAHAGTGSRLLRTPAWMAKSTLRVLEAMRMSPLYKWIYGTADQDSFVSVDRLRALGWEPKHSNASTLISTYDWYCDHHDQIPAAGTGHRVPWREGALALVKRFL